HIPISRPMQPEITSDQVDTALALLDQSADDAALKNAIGSNGAVSASELRAVVKRQLGCDRALSVLATFEAAVIDYILETNYFEVPSELVEAEAGELPPSPERSEVLRGAL